VGLLGSGSVTVRFYDAIEVVTLRSSGCCLYTRLINKAYDLPLLSVSQTSVY
jgi:hypothetical protein